MFAQDELGGGNRKENVLNPGQTITQHNEATWASLEGLCNIRGNCTRTKLSHTGQ